MIIKDGKICGGEPIIQGTRISVSNILNHIREGSGSEEIIELYPWITLDDINDCIQYGRSHS